MLFILIIQANIHIFRETDRRLEFFVTFAVLSLYTLIPQHFFL